MGLWLADLRCGDMKPVLQLREEALYDRPFFFQAVNPRGVEAERNGGYFHGCLHNFEEDHFTAGSLGDAGPEAVRHQIRSLSCERLLLTLIKTNVVSETGI